MKTRFAVALTALIALPAAAHDPALHKQDDAKQSADCAQMKNMDMSKMNPNDPVMKAMHEKCAAGMHGDDHKAAPATGADAHKNHDHKAGDKEDKH
jgi:hypothetical protein